MQIDYTTVTEIAYDLVSREQIERIYHRYFWAGDHCRGKDVVEAGCGTGQGAGYLVNISKSYHTGDYSDDVIKIAAQHYCDRIGFQKFDAQQMPFENNSKDVVILFEAIYHLPDARKFVSECARILRPNGKVLIATANKDLFDFTPSAYSYQYYNVVETEELFRPFGFNCEFFGNVPTDRISVRQKMLRPIKKIAVKLNLVPNTMRGKRILKRIVFGGLVPMPAEIKEEKFEYRPPIPIPRGQPDTIHKVIYCCAIRKNGE